MKLTHTIIAFALSAINVVALGQEHLSKDDFTKEAKLFVVSQIVPKLQAANSGKKLTDGLSEDVKRTTEGKNLTAVLAGKKADQKFLDAKIDEAYAKLKGEDSGAVRTRIWEGYKKQELEKVEKINGPSQKIVLPWPFNKWPEK